MTDSTPAPRRLALLLAALGGCAGPGALSPIAESPEFPELDSSYQRPVPRDPGCIAGRLAAGPNAHQEGRVVLRVGVDADGKVRQVTVVGNTIGPDERLLEALVEAARACEWTPGEDAEGRPVQVFALLSVDFARRSTRPPLPDRPARSMF